MGVEMVMLMRLDIGVGEAVEMAMVLSGGTGALMMVLCCAVMRRCY